MLFINKKNREVIIFQIVEKKSQLKHMGNVNQSFLSNHLQ